MITAFSLHLVKTGVLDVELGRSLNKVEDVRLMADYMGASVEHSDKVVGCNAQVPSPP